MTHPHHPKQTPKAEPTVEPPRFLHRTRVLVRKHWWQTGLGAVVVGAAIAWFIPHWLGNIDDAVKWYYQTRYKTLPEMQQSISNLEQQLDPPGSSG